VDAVDAVPSETAMLLIAGREPLLLPALRSLLAERGRPAIEVPDDRRDGGDLFMAAFEAKAELILALEPLAVLGAPPEIGSSGPAAADQALIDAAVAGSRAPGVRLLIVVTSRADADPALERLRASGAPYVVFRPRPLARLEVELEGGLLGKRVIVDAEAEAVSRDAQGAATPRHVAEEVLDALEGAEVVGRTIEIASDDLLVRLVAEAGARPETSRGLGGVFRRLIGAPIVVPDPVGARVVRARTGRTRSQASQPAAAAPSSDDAHSSR
jgi:hypothetical protein